MIYRREIDGLRALAVVPVMLFHAGFKVFSGGFVGVDVFFVISGYLITSIIISDLQRGEFRLMVFYERRIRRILPALYVVMAASSVAAYEWMMPDELKNYGQSVLATSLFSNNILLAITSGYWALASEFKPLLHTWSLGVEEQFYICFPFFLILGWKYFRQQLVLTICVIAALSLAAAVWGVVKSPDAAFYLLPTRAWEILLGAMVAFYLKKTNTMDASVARRQSLSLLGFLLIVASVFVFDQNEPSPGLYTLLPAIGAVLIILYASQGTVVGSLLGSKIMVGIGLISYSAYLWHQPIIAFSRVLSKAPPSGLVMAALVAATFGLAFMTWKFVETPCRNRTQVSRRAIFLSSIVLSALFVILGFYLDVSYGLPLRVFDASVTKEDIDKRIYNERVFRFKKDAFSRDGRLRVLVIGNSYGRDFVNMTIETFDLRKIEILYRDDLPDCILPYADSVAQTLFHDADMIVFASGNYDTGCVDKNIEFAHATGKDIFYIGTKAFGYNLNWVVRLSRQDRANRFNALPLETIGIEKNMSTAIPGDNYISLLASIATNGQIPITDGKGRPISTDRVHVTKFGAQFIGAAAILHSRYGKILKQYGN